MLATGAGTASRVRIFSVSLTGMAATQRMWAGRGVPGGACRSIWPPDAVNVPGSAWWCVSKQAGVAASGRQRRRRLSMYRPDKPKPCLRSPARTREALQAPADAGRIPPARHAGRGTRVWAGRGVPGDAAPTSVACAAPRPCEARDGHGAWAAETGAERSCRWGWGDRGNY